MNAKDRIDQLTEQTTGVTSDRSVSVGVAVASVLIVLCLLAPLAWILLQAAAIPVDRLFDLLTRAKTVAVTRNSLALVVSVTVGSILVGVPLAILTVQTDLPFRRFWTVTSALPLVIPSYIGAFAFVSTFGPSGLLADLLAPYGVEGIPEIYGYHATVLVLTLYTYPYVFLTTRAALLSFDGTLVEAARTLNHSRWAAFRRVTVPQIAPGVAAGALLVALYALSDFGTPALLRYDVFTRMIYNEFGARRLDFASVLSILLLAMALVVLAVESRLNANRDGAYVSRGARRPGQITLGPLKWPALAFCASVATLGLVVPIGVLMLWLTRSGPAYQDGGLMFRVSYATNSLALAAGAAAVCVVLALPIAYLSTRSNGRLGSLTERASYVGYAVPGVVLGLALVSLGIEYLPFLYPHVGLLLFAYVVRFLPQSVGTTESSLLQIDARYVEAARSLGYSPLRAFRTVVLPLVAPGIAAGAALVFLTTMKELPATLMLRPFGFETFVTYIWLAQEAGYYGQAAIPALVLVFVSGLSMVVILRRERTNATE